MENVIIQTTKLADVGSAGFRGPRIIPDQSDNFPIRNEIPNGNIMNEPIAPDGYRASLQYGSVRLA